MSPDNQNLSTNNISPMQADSTAFDRAVVVSSNAAETSQNRGSSLQKKQEAAASDTQSTSEAMERFYRRNPSLPYAPASASPNVRNSGGQTYYYNHPIPLNLKLNYTELIELLKKRRPDIAAAIQDGIDRIENARTTLAQVQQEVEQSQQQHNEDARLANRKIDEEIEHFQQKLDTIEQQQNKIIIDMRDDFYNLRAKLAEYRSLLGEEAEHIYFKDRPDLFPEPALPAPTQQTPGTSLIPASNTAIHKNMGSAIASVSRAWGNLYHTLSSSRAQNQPANQTEPPVYKPVKVDYPLEEAREQVRSLQAIAACEGLPSHSKTSLSWSEKFMVFLALLACGSIFGFSIGIITGVIDPQIIALRPMLEAAPLSAALALGIGLFWVLGEAVQRWAEHASENYHTANLASIRSDPKRMGECTKKTFTVHIVLLASVTCLFVLIEAAVEWNGIVHYFNQHMLNQMLATGQVHQVSAGLSTGAMLGMSLMASVPFLVMHMVEGWTLAYGQTIQNHLINLQENDMHARSEEIHKKRLEEARAQREKWEMSQNDSTAVEHVQSQLETAQITGSINLHTNEQSQTASDDASPPAYHNSSTPLLMSDYSSNPVIDAIVPPGDEAADDSLPSSQPASDTADTASLTDAKPSTELQIRSHISSLQEKVQGKYQALQEQREYSKVRTAHYYNRIRQLEEERRLEHSIIQQEGRQRIDDAYRNMEGAAVEFDALIKQKRKDILRTLHGGILSRLRKWLYDHSLTE